MDRCSVSRKVETTRGEKKPGEMATDFTAEEPLPASFVNFFGGLKVEKRLSQLELTNFDPSESRALLKGELGAIEPAVMEQMVEWSEGSPFLLSSYIEEWKENENLEPLPDIIQAYLSQELRDMSSEEEAFFTTYLVFISQSPVYLGRIDGYRASCFDRINRAFI